MTSATSSSASATAAAGASTNRRCACIQRSAYASRASGSNGRMSSPRRRLRRRCRSASAARWSPWRSTTRSYSGPKPSRSRFERRVPRAIAPSTPSTSTTAIATTIQITSIPLSVGYVSPAGCARPCMPVERCGRRADVRARTSAAPRLTQLGGGQAVVAQLLRRGAVQQPGAVLAARDRSRARQLAQRGRDARAGRADEVGEALVAQGQRDGDAVRAHASPALGEVPEREHEAVLDALVVRDGQRHREVVRPARPAREELHAELREGHHPLDQPVVQDGEIRRLEQAPAHLGADVRALLVPLPGSQDVAGTQQLHATPAEDLDLAGQEPVQEQEAAMVAVGLARSGDVPGARRETHDAREDVPSRPLAVVGRDDRLEVVVLVDERDGWAGGHGAPHPPCPSADVPARTAPLPGRAGDGHAAGRRPDQSKGAVMLWLIIGVVLLIIAIAGGTIVHPILFVIAILAILAFLASRRGAAF